MAEASALAARKVIVLLALALSACPGPDRMTEPVVSEGGTYFSALHDSGTTGGTGGKPASSNDAGFDWGPSNYDATGGLTVSYQDHFNGEPCFVTCHDHGISLGGTVYLANSPDTASNAEIGVWLGGVLLNSYSGSGGNFFTNSLGNLNWANAVIAVRSANGTTYMPANPNANGDCNTCHDSTHRIVVP